MVTVLYLSVVVIAVLVKLLTTIMENAGSRQKLYTRMRLWEFPNEYVIEPTDGTSDSFLVVSRVDGSMKLLGLVSLFYSLLWANFLPAFIWTLWLPLVFLLRFLLSRWTSTVQFCTCTQVTNYLWCDWGAKTLGRHVNFFIPQISFEGWNFLMRSIINFLTLIMVSTLEANYYYAWIYFLPLF